MSSKATENVVSDRSEGGKGGGDKCGLEHGGSTERTDGSLSPVWTTSDATGDE